MLRRGRPGRRHRARGQPGIVAVIGTCCSSSALGVADTILGDKGIILFSPVEHEPGPDVGGGAPALLPAYGAQRQDPGRDRGRLRLHELGIDTAATINDESPYADGLAAAFRDNFEALGGTITDTEQVSSSDTDLGPVFTNIAATDPGVVYGPNFNPVCALSYTQGSDILAKGTVQIGSDGCLESSFLDTVGPPVKDFAYYASSPDVSAFQGGAFYKDQYLPAYTDQFGEPTSVFNAHAFDATNILFDAIEATAVDDGSGNLTISRTALKDALFATSGYEGVTGTITCTPLGDCATDVTIGVFEYDHWRSRVASTPPTRSSRRPRRWPTSSGPNGTARCGWAPAHPQRCLRDGRLPRMATATDDQVRGAQLGWLERLPWRRIILVLLSIVILAVVAIGAYKTLTLPAGQGYPPTTWKEFVILGVARRHQRADRHRATHSSTGSCG